MVGSIQKINDKSSLDSQFQEFEFLRWNPILRRTGYRLAKRLQFSLARPHTSNLHRYLAYPNKIHPIVSLRTLILIVTVVNNGTYQIKILIFLYCSKTYTVLMTSISRFYVVLLLVLCTVVWIHRVNISLFLEPLPSQKCLRRDRRSKANSGTHHPLILWKTLLIDIW